MTPCEQLEEAAPAERDLRAFECYVLPEVDVLYRVALSLTRNPHDAEDLVQETLARAHGAIDRFDGRHPRAWLLTILRNTHVNSLRRRRPDLLRDPEASIEEVGGREGEHEPDPAQLFDDAGFDSAVEHALAELPESFRSVVSLVDIAGMSYQEASEALGVPVGTVMSRLHRARKRMKRSLEMPRNHRSPSPSAPPR